MTYDIENSWVWRLFTRKKDVKYKCPYCSTESMPEGGPMCTDCYEKCEKIQQTEEKSKQMTVKEILRQNGVSEEFINPEVPDRFPPPNAMTIDEIMNLNDAEFIRYIESCTMTYLITGGRHRGKLAMKRRYAELLKQRAAELTNET